MHEGQFVAAAIIQVIIQCAIVAAFLYVIAKTVTALKMRYRARKDRLK